MAKGAGFEREICHLLSNWWAGKDDVFWRTANSGGRATSRHKKGKTTTGQHSDIGCIDPIGLPFTELVTLEIKRGYTKFSIQDLLDREYIEKEQTYEEWFTKTYRSHKRAKTYTWAVITRRDKRQAMIWLPMPCWGSLLVNAFYQSVYTIVKFKRIRGDWMFVMGMRLSRFLRICTPKMIKDYHQRFKDDAL